MRDGSINLTKKEQQQVLSKFKTTKSARTIAESLDIPRRRVMAFLDNKGLTCYSEGSYA